MTLLVLLIIVILLVVVIRALLRDARDRREHEARQSREQDEAKRREHARELSRLYKELNRSLGFPEGTGPTGIMVGGEYHVVNVGHTERLKNDPTYALTDELAGIILEVTDLEAALKEANARSDISLASKIRTELSHLNERAMAMADELKMVEKQQKPAVHPRLEPTPADSPAGAAGRQAFHDFANSLAGGKPNVEAGQAAACSESPLPSPPASPVAGFGTWHNYRQQRRSDG